MAYVWFAPMATFVVPEGKMLPLAPAVAVIVGINVAAIVWAVCTFEKVQLVITPSEVPSTVTLPMA